MGATVKKKEYTNEVFLAFLAVAIVALLVKWPLITKQNNQFVAEQARFQQATQLLQEGKTAQAEPLLADCVKIWPNNPDVARYYGIALAYNHKSKQAEAYMSKAEQLKPALLMDASFLLQHARMLEQNGQYEEARFYVLMSKKYSNTPQLTQMADKLLTEINHHAKAVTGR